MDRVARRSLEFAATQNVVTAEQIGAAVGSGHMDRGELDGLMVDGLLRRVRIRPDFDVFCITSRGLEAIESKLGEVRLGARGVRRSIGAAWVWLRARDGRFEATEAVLSERELIVGDSGARADVARSARPYGLRVAGARPATASGLAYPDVLVAFHDGWCAVHVQLTSIGARELEALLSAYGADERYGRVVFLTDRAQVAAQVRAAAVSVGLAGVTSVQPMEFG